MSEWDDPPVSTTAPVEVKITNTIDEMAPIIQLKCQMFDVKHYYIDDLTELDSRMRCLI